MDESGFRHCYGNFFESAILKVTWSQLYSNFFLNNCEVHGQQYFKDRLNMNILRTWIKIRATSFIKTWVNIKRKLTKVPWKLSLAEKYDPALQRTLHQTRWCFAYCCMLLFLSNKPSISNPVFIDILDSFCHSLFTFLHFDCWYSTEFEFHPVPLYLFYKNQSNVDEVQYFFKVFSLKMFILCLKQIIKISTIDCHCNFLCLSFPSSKFS